MATYTEKCVVEGTQLAASVATLYTTPASTKLVGFDVVIANNNDAAVTATLHLVASGGSAGAANMILPTITIPGHGIIAKTFRQILEAGDFIAGFASTATAVVIRISGVEKA